MLFVAVGLAAVVIGRRYPFGTTASMGPGYFPAVLGGLLVALGAVAAGRSLRRGFHMLECPPAPLLLGSILGPMMEENLRRALLISGGDASVFVSRPHLGGAAPGSGDPCGSPHPAGPSDQAGGGVPGGGLNAVTDMPLRQGITRRHPGCQGGDGPAEVRRA